jgi:hypothetical protein
MDTMIDDETRRDTRPRSSITVLGPLFGASVIAMALAYRTGWSQSGYGEVLYWLAQLMVFTPALWWLARRRQLGGGSALGMVVAVAVTHYLFKWMYSPDLLRFPDELQHWRATTNIDATGELFGWNESLPISRFYPGLATFAEAFSSMTGLSVTATAFVLMGLVRVATVGVLYTLTRHITRSVRIAAIAVLLLATSPHWLFFGSMFIYSNLAYLFAVVALCGAWCWRTRRGAPATALVLAVSGIAATIVTHHVTAIVLAVVLVAIGALTAKRERDWHTAVLGGGAVVATAVWNIVVAGDLPRYLDRGADADGAWQRFTDLVRGDFSSSASSPVAGSWADRGFAMAAFAFIAVALAFAVPYVLRNTRGTWLRAAAWGALAFYPLLVLRAGGVVGSQTFGRLSTYVWPAVTVTLAVAAVAVTVDAATGYVIRRRVAAATAAGTLMLVGGLCAGWPAPWGRLPGPYLAEAFERSVDAQTVDAAEWSLDHLGAGQPFAGSVMQIRAFTTYGNQSDASYWFGKKFIDRDSLDAESAGFARITGLRYVVLDDRLTTAVPYNGIYFRGDPRSRYVDAPLDRGALERFDTTAGIGRIYDSGDVKIYDIEEFSNGQ